MATNRCSNTVEIGGQVIARFVLSEDAVFFARTANEAGLFSITHPGQQATAYDQRGNDISTPDTYTTR